MRLQRPPVGHFKPGAPEDARRPHAEDNRRRLLPGALSETLPSIPTLPLDMPQFDAPCRPSPYPLPFAMQNGAILASCSADKTVRLWAVDSGEWTRQRHDGDHHSREATSLAASPDCSILASGSKDACVRLWDARTGELLMALDGHEGEVTSVAFSPCGKAVASGARDKTVRLWDAVSGRLVATLEDRAAEVLSVAFSPDGATLASGMSDTTVRLWAAGSDDMGTLLAILEGHTGPVTSVALFDTPDGTRLASGSTADNAVRLWAIGARAANVAADGSPTVAAVLLRMIDGSHDAAASALMLSPAVLGSTAPVSVAPAAPRPHHRLACSVDSKGGCVSVGLEPTPAGVAASLGPSLITMPLGMEADKVFASAMAFALGPPLAAGGPPEGTMERPCGEMVSVGGRGDDAAAMGRAPLLFVFLKGSADGRVMRFRAVD